MAKNYFSRYVWLIDTISRYGHITLPEISRQWQRSSLNEDGAPLAERTFHNHREAILDTFRIDIKCDRSLGYYIANSDDLGGDGIRQWLLESLSMNNLLNESADMRDRILFESIPSSRKWLPVVVNSIRNKKALEITYQSFRKDEPSTFTVHPYCLKLFRQRWYMLARSEEFDSPWIYALDERMHDATPLKKPLRVPAGFDAEDFFSRYFGVIITDRKPTEIKLKVDEDQVNYFKSLPLHKSQEHIGTGPGYSVFRYFLVPTFDFRQEILSHGPAVEVLEPEDLRDEVKADILQMYKNYGL